MNYQWKVVAGTEVVRDGQKVTTGAIYVYVLAASEQEALEKASFIVDRPNYSIVEVSETVQGLIDERYRELMERLVRAAERCETPESET